MIFDLWLLCQISALPWLEVCKEPTVFSSHNWRTLMVPDWSLVGWSPHWHHESSWYVILDLCAKFQLSSMNGSVSRTPLSWKSYLEEVEGSWLDTWRMRSLLTCWIILEDPQELVLKVSWRSDLIWLRYLRTKNAPLFLCLFVCSRVCHILSQTWHTAVS